MGHLLPLASHIRKRKGVKFGSWLIFIIKSNFYHFILNAGGITSCTLFLVQCHLGTLSHTCSPLA